MIGLRRSIVKVMRTPVGWGRCMPWNVSTMQLLNQTHTRLASTFSLDDEGNLNVTEKMKASFGKDGFVVVKNLLSADELTKIQVALETDGEILKRAYEVNDGEEGSNSKLCLWNQPGNDITGMVARSKKVAGTAAALLGGEVYHYHTKLMMKEPLTGGAFVWHQDYGYWYQNGCLFPDMLTAFIAIDKCTPENGCMQVLCGSHKAGRIDHTTVGGQTGADMDRVMDLQKVCPLMHVPLDPGDCLFFHGNLLHASSKNPSVHRRWAFLCAYNTKRNNPTRIHHHPQYSPLDIVENTAIISCPPTTRPEGKDFLNPKDDRTSKSVDENT